jgi:hypothetical protein
VTTSSTSPDRDALGSSVLDALGKALEWAAENHPDSLRGSVAAGFFSLFEESDDLSEFLDSLDDEPEVEWLLFMAHEWAIAEGPIEPEAGQTPIFLRDAVLADGGAELDEEQRRVLQAFTESALRLGKVEAVHDTTLDLVDLLDGEQFTVVNMLEEDSVEVGEVLGVRPLDLGGPTLVPSPCLYAFDAEDGEALAQELAEAIEENPDQKRLILATWIASAWLEATYGLTEDDDIGDDDQEVLE